MASMIPVQARQTLTDVLNWYMAAMRLDMLGPKDADRFPSLQIMDAVFKDDHWAIKGAFDALDGWLARNQALTAEISRQTGKALLPKTVTEAKARFSGLFLAWEERDDGMVTSLPLDAAPTSHRRFHSLGDAAMNGGIAVSVFDHPLKAVDVYNGTEALAAGPSGLKDLKPVGRIAEYRIAIMDGRIVHPPAWPAQLLSEMAERTAKPDTDDPEP